MTKNEAIAKIRRIKWRVDLLQNVCDNVAKVAKRVAAEDPEHPSLQNAARITETIAKLVRSQVEEAKLYASFIGEVPENVLTERLR